jgi:UMF1 family MFS transporter
VSGWAARVGLDRRELRAWALYDWGNSAFATTVMGAVLPVYYAGVAAVDLPPNLRTAYWGYTHTAALLLIALISPLLGAVADFTGARKRFLAFFAGLGILATALLARSGSGEWLYVSLVYVAANLGFAAANVFYESLLPHLVGRDLIDRVSTSGYALGYVGGGLLLALNLVWIQLPGSFGLADAAAASRLSFLSVALWWAVFSVPLLRHVPEPARRLVSGERAGSRALVAGLGRLAGTIREVRSHRQVFLFLLAFWFYNDGINTIIKMATIYGAELGLGQGHLIGAFVLVQFLGIPTTFAWGAVADRLGARRGIQLTLLVYAAISVGGYFMTRPWHFWALAAAVALVQGGSQALSRSLFALLVPPSKASEFFGFYALSGRLGTVLGPLVFAVVAQSAGTSRVAIISLVVFFAVGAALVSAVDVEAGRQAALEDAGTPVLEA